MMDEHLQLLDERLLQLTEIIENHFGLGLSTQTLSDLRIVTEITQQAVADTLCRNSAEPLFDQLQRFTRRRRCFHRQQHWKDGGKPADRARKVQVRQNVFTPVTFQINYQSWLAGPSSECLDQRRQQ